MAHAGIKCTTLVLVAPSKLNYSQVKWCMSNPSCNLPREYGLMTNVWRKAVRFLGEQKIIASVNVLLFHTHSGKDIACIFLLKIYRKIRTELYTPLLSHSCLSTCLYYLISFTMLQYHVEDCSNALNHFTIDKISFKLCVPFLPPDYISVFLSRNRISLRISLKFLGFLWISMHLFSKLVKGFMGVWLITGSRTLGLEVFIAMAVKCSAAWSRNAQILLLK